MLLLYSAALIGLLVLVYGADLFVRASVNIATHLRVSPLIIGLTIVALGTSAPEVAVSLNAIFDGNQDIALGNIIGSNIFNILFVLGLTSIFIPLAVKTQIIKIELPFMIFVSFLALIFAQTGILNIFHGLVFLVLFIIFNFTQVYFAKKEKKLRIEDFQLDLINPKAINPKIESLKFFLAAIFLVVGSKLFVYGAAGVAEAYSISKLIVGITIVAIGTSLPEVATSIAAALRGHSDMAIGNAIGSNIYNILLVLGISSLGTKYGLAVDAMAIGQDLPFMLFVSILLLPILHSGLRLSRLEGLSLLLLYIAYISLLIIQALNKSSVGSFQIYFLYICLAFVLLYGIIFLKDSLLKKEKL